MSLEQSVNQIPDKEAGEFSDKQQDHCPEGTGLVESQGDGDDISYERYPCGKG